ncbi:MAG: DUF5658 family protein [Desulfobacterales bacterium]|nr:DUF5658 family protein [Desulfobacterales bacterium]
MVEERTASGWSASEGERQERRSGGDRRRRQHFRLRFLLSGGRRVLGRRYEDRQRILFFDRYQQVQFGIIAGILFFSVMDALLTLYLLEHGAIEINPIMAFYLDAGPYTFLFVKYGLTSAGVIIILLLHGFFLKTLRVNAGVLLYFVLVAFLGVFSWQIYLIRKVAA